MIAIKIKPLSVNEAWQGRRFKTKAYKEFQEIVLLMLPNIEAPEGKFRLNLEFGFSNAQSDIDNPIKMILDILQKKYGFNDNKIYELFVTKKVCNKGAEYFMFNFVSL